MLTYRSEPGESELIKQWIIHHPRHYVERRSDGFPNFNDWESHRVVKWLSLNCDEVCDYEDPVNCRMTSNSDVKVDNQDSKFRCDYIFKSGPFYKFTCDRPGSVIGYAVRCKFHNHPIFNLIDYCTEHAKY